MFQIVQGKYKINCLSIGLPDLYYEYKKNAKFVDEINIKDNNGESFFIAIGEGNSWPYMVIAQRYNPSAISGFYPSILLIPEKEIMFVGAGERISLYDLNKKTKIWEDSADTGFWNWAVYKKYVIMTAELEFAVFNDEGNKLWTTFVEPPWDYQIKDDIVELNIMGNIQKLNIKNGSAA